MRFGWRRVAIPAALCGAAVVLWTGSRRVAFSTAAEAAPAAAAGAAAGAIAGAGLGEAVSSAPNPSDDPNAADLEGDDQSSFETPTGNPASLDCDEARRVVAQAKETLAYPPPPVKPAALASGTVDWLDPHGLWSAAPGTPVAGAIERRAPQLVRELETYRGTCAAAHEVGQTLVRWMAELKKTFRAHRAAPPASLALAAAVGDPIADDGDSSRPAPAFAAFLGDHVGAAEHAMGALGAPYARAAEARFVPDLDAEGWTRAVLAAEVRAYVTLIDPHGAWAPLEEEASVYEVDLDANPPAALWDRVSRTAVGVRIESGAIPPLANGDVVLSLAQVLTAGLPTEQIEQLAIVAADTRGTSEAIVLRSGETAPRVLAIDPAAAVGEATQAAHDGLTTERVPYGDGTALVVAIPEVKDDLGDQLTKVVAGERARPDPAKALVLDLRGNGGGSTDGAVAALGLFMPGAPLFPMRRRDGSLEIERAPEPAANERWPGKVATLVDGNTASAAEMIAGALAAYHRGPTVGRSTYGKGCAQEYADDDAHAGVLRLTTLLYALPDGSAVQRVGLSPNVRIPFALLPGEDTSGETEGALPDAPPTWAGPDQRDRTMTARFDAEGDLQWPAAGGRVGPCKDGDVCKALRALGAGAPAPVVAAGHVPGGRTPSERATSIARRNGP